MLGINVIFQNKKNWNFPVLFFRQKKQLPMNFCLDFHINFIMLKLNPNNVNSVKNGQYKPGYFILREFARPMVVMMSAVVGVGFVSGAELWSFFARFGEFCWVGIFVFAILFFWLTLKIVSKNTTSEKYVKLYKTNKNTLKYTFLTKTHVKKVLLFFSELFIASAMFS